MREWICIINIVNFLLFARATVGRACVKSTLFERHNPILDNSLDCLLEIVSVQEQSRLIIQEKYAEPDTHGWLRCFYCGMKDNNLILFDNFDSWKLFGTLSWSHWGEFFHYNHNDQYKSLVASTSDSLLLIVNRPVYVVPMITFHIGHVLVDFLEQIYFNMVDNYGEVRKDAIIIIDVAGSDERVVLMDKLDLSTFNCASSMDFGCLMRDAFTDSAFYSVDLLTELTHLAAQYDCTLVFEDLHVGLDISKSFYQKGYNTHPSMLSSDNNDVKESARRYQQFTTYLNDFVKSKFHEVASTVEVPSLLGGDAMQQSAVTPPLKVLIVQRKKDRLILNVDELVAAIESLGLSAMEVVLEETSFEEQWKLFASVDILIAVAGTALHNMMFMRPRQTAVIVIMQSHQWCHWAWMYVNQAVLLDIEPIVYCPSDTTYTINGVADFERDGSSYYAEQNTEWQISRRFWRQAPRHSKANNVTLDLKVFRSLLHTAKQSVMMLHGNNHSKGDATIVRQQDLNVVNVGTQIGNKRSIGLVELWLSDVIIKSEDIQTSSWQLGLQLSIRMKERGIEFSGQAAVKSLESMPHLSMCMRVLSTLGNPQDSDAAAVSPVPWCYPVSGFNYLSEILLRVAEPLLFVRFWTQMAPSGGKLRHSDLFYLLDCRLPKCGLALTECKSNVNLSVFIGNECIHDSGTLVQKVWFSASSAVANDVNSRMCQVTRHAHFSGQFNSQYDFQRYVATFCRENSVSEWNCGVILQKVSQKVWFEKKLSEFRLPSVQNVPTPQEPFVFVHVEKTGGTTMREFISESADLLGLQSFIPCHGNIHCVTLELSTSTDYPSLNNVSVVAGHFFWDVWSQLPTFISHSANNVKDEQNNASDEQQNELSDSAVCPSCLIIGRHPVERAISYYYQRCYQLETCVGYRRRINDLSSEELEFIAIQERQGGYAADNTTLVILDEGMSNAACRTVGGFKATTGIHVTSDSTVVPLPPALTEAQIVVAVKNVAHCVVGLLERWNDTLTVVREWFPWIDLHKDRDRKKMFLYSGKETQADIRADLLEVLLRLNDCDLRLYNEMKRLFDVQLSVLKEKDLYFQ